MNCPKCKHDMHIKRHDESRNDFNGMRYSRMFYNCETDDIWITLEIPTRKVDLGLTSQTLSITAIH